AVALPHDPPGRVERDHGGDAPVHGARDPAVLQRAAGLRRGSHAHGGEGVKLAVLGAASTYTPELVSGLSRERERVPLDELVLHDIDPERRRVVGEMAARMLERQGFG